MAVTHLIVLSIPGLRPGDVQKQRTPTLFDWANRGAIAELTPTFPCVTSTVQASMLTGTPPARHGVIANGFFDRAVRQVAFWVAPNSVIERRQVFDVLRQQRPQFQSAAWHMQNIKGAPADYVVTPAPIHEADGTTRLWCYSKPDGLYQELLELLGHFPLQHYWGPLAGIESSRWILRAAAWLSRKQQPNLHWIYVPHLDYAAQKYGPDSGQAQAALVELDKELAAFAADVAESPIGAGVAYLVAGEYALTGVDTVAYPNRLLREAGLLAVDRIDGAEQVDLVHSKAFAMVDHQFAHVFVQDGDCQVVKRVRELFASTPSVAGVHVGNERCRIGLDHERAGDVILISEERAWFAYYWWLDVSAAPSYARTVDIHRKPGYDPVELFFDPATKGIPLTPGLVKGSHGIPATEPRHRTALICSEGLPAHEGRRPYRDTEIMAIVLGLL